MRPGRRLRYTLIFWSVTRLGFGVWIAPRETVYPVEGSDEAGGYRGIDAWNGLDDL